MMSFPTQDVEQRNARQVLEGFGASYRNDGFRFVIAPEGDELPEFLRGFPLDAVAVKEGADGVAVVTLDSLRHLDRNVRTALVETVKAHPGWRLTVVNIARKSFQPVIPVATPDALRARMADISALLTAGHRREAFVSAWSLLEAALHRVDPERKGRPVAGSALVEGLTTLGYLGQETARALTALVTLRNRIVHGDLAAEPTAADVERVLQAVAETLADEPA